jgi:hypothetical protein
LTERAEAELQQSASYPVRVQVFKDGVKRDYKMAQEGNLIAVSQTSIQSATANRFSKASHREDSKQKSEYGLSVAKVRLARMTNKLAQSVDNQPFVIELDSRFLCKTVPGHNLAPIK